MLPRTRAVVGSLAISLLALTACGNSSNSESAEDLLKQPSSSSAAASSSPATSPTPSATSASPTSTPSTEQTTASNSPSASSTASPTPAPQQTTATAVAKSGTDCGPSNTGRTTLVLAEGSVSCDQVERIFAQFNSNFAAGEQSSTVEGYSCSSLSPEETEYSGRTVTCISGGNRLEAMTQYPLGGIPVTTGQYKVEGEYVYFHANGLGCAVGDGSAACQRNAVDPSKGVMEFMGYSTSQAPAIEQGGGNVGPNPLSDAPSLPTGYVITAYGQSCLNDGVSLTCTDGNGKTFRANATEFTVE